MSDPKTLLKLNGVSKAYESLADGGAVDVLKDITLEIASGESVSLVGPSGSGKSTFLNIVGTLDQPTSGSVALDGEDLANLDEQRLAEIRNREIGWIFQSHHLLPQCSVIENVLVPTLVCADAELNAGAEERARRLLDRVGLKDRIAHRPGQLSGGERQRVAVVRALINRPKLLLADEPTGALDRVSADNLGQLLVELNKEEGVTLIMVTHAPDLAARMGRSLELRDGNLV